MNQRTSQAGSSSCQCLMTLYGDAKGSDDLCENNSKTIKKYAERFPRGHWSFLGAWICKEVVRNLRLQT